MDTLKPASDKRAKYKKKLSTLQEEEEYKESDSPANMKYGSFQNRDSLFNPQTIIEEDEHRDTK